MESKEIIGNNIKTFRAAQGFRQEDLAEYLDVTRSMISYYESGERDIPIASLNKLADLFGVELKTLLEENEEIARTNLAFAFRNENFTSKDLESIASFKKFVLDYLKMERLRNA
jgi:transcriptional regulator with XRE-family HTH domain